MLGYVPLAMSQAVDKPAGQTSPQYIQFMLFFEAIVVASDAVMAISSTRSAWLLRKFRLSELDCQFRGHMLLRARMTGSCPGSLRHRRMQASLSPPAGQPAQRRHRDCGTAERTFDVQTTGPLPIKTEPPQPCGLQIFTLMFIVEIPERCMALHVVHTDTLKPVKDQLERG